MAAKRTLIRLLSAWIAVSALGASEYRGTVKSGGLPVPGVTVTAIQGEKRIVTTTDDQGLFRFADLADGNWTIDVEMLGFAKNTRPVAVASGAPPAEWDLKLMSREALLASLNRRSAPGPEAKKAAAAPARTFQRVDVNQSSETAALGNEGAITNEEAADLTQRTANSFIVQGSVSSALGMGQQNDWGFGPRGMGFGPPGGPGMMGPGAPGMEGRDGPNTPGAPGSGPALATAGPIGRGGFAGPRGPGGFGGFGGPGGPGGFGGPGRARFERGREGRDRRGWQGRPNAMAFGNARRDPRGSYMGMASFSLDNSIWDARTFSVTGASIDKPAYANARGNIMIGGPLRIPKLVSADKHILFTFDYQFLRSRTGVNSQPVNMPSAQERSGDFSQLPVTIYDPATGKPFPGNQIPASRINAASAALLQYFPLPNLPFAARNYQTSWSGVNNSQNINARVANLRIGSKDRLNAAIGYQGGNTVSPNLFQFIDTGSGRSLNANLGWSHNITTRLINNLRYTFSRNRQLLSPYFASRQNVAAELDIAGTSQNPLNWGPPNLGFTNYAGLNDGSASLNRNQTSSLGNTLMWIRGTHNFAFGGEYRRQQFNQFGDSNGRGAYTFNGSAAGYDMADFLLGMPTTSSIRYGNPDKYFRGAGYSVFVNDDWRLSSKFTLIGGIRWDYATPVTELYNRLANLALSPGFTAATAVVPGQIHPDRDNFSPRLGFAWRPRSKGSMVVRGGYGIYYNTSVYSIVASNMAQQPPFAETLSVSSSAANPLSIQNGFLLASSRAISTYAIDPSYRIGYAQTWNLTIQNDLPWGMFGTIGYLGTKGTRLDQQFIPNSVPPGAPESLLPHGFIYETSNGNSIYHAAQFQLHRRFRSGFMAHAGYQFSKSIDNAGTGGRGQGGTPVAQDWLDLSAERALSSFDSRHNLSLQIQYSTGMGRQGGTLLNGWRGALIKDWTVSSNISLHSGNPFTATIGGNRSQVGGTAVTNTVRADAIGLPVSVPGMLFNTAAFALPAAGLWGNAGRNTIPGPAVFFLNGAVGRVFRLGERRSIDLQMQAQNVLNHVTITNWGTVLGANNFGLATGAAAMRRVTANLRIRF